MKTNLPLLICGAALLAGSPMMATLTVTLTPTVPSPQPLGTTITWNAAVVGDPDPSPTYEYTFSAEPNGAPCKCERVSLIPTHLSGRRLPSKAYSTWM